MKPEPWGEALDAVAADGRRARRADPVGPAVHPGRRRRALDPRAPGLRVRSLRGHRPAGDGRRRDADGGARALDRRLRAQRRRGGGARDHRGRRTPAARVHGQRRVPRRGVARRRAAGVPRLHEAGHLARPRGARGAALRRPRTRSPPGATTSPYAGPRSAAPTWPTRRGPSTSGHSPARSLWRHRRTPPSCSPSSARAGSRSSRPTRRRASRRCTRTSPTCRPGWGSGPRWCCAAAGRLVGAVRGRLDGDAWDIGRLMVAPDLQGRGIGRLLLEAIEHAAPDEATSYVLFTGALSERNIRIYKKAGYRLLGPTRLLPAPYAWSRSAVSSRRTRRRSRRGTRPAARPARSGPGGEPRR